MVLDLLMRLAELLMHVIVGSLLIMVLFSCVVQGIQIAFSQQSLRSCPQHIGGHWVKSQD